MKNEKNYFSLETSFQNDLLVKNEMFFLRGGDGDLDDNNNDGSNSSGTGTIVP